LDEKATLLDIVGFESWAVQQLLVELQKITDGAVVRSVVLGVDHPVPLKVYMAALSAASVPIARQCVASMQ
jgi:hypothetical protein